MITLSAGARKLRSNLLTPSLREVDPEVRGFYGWAEGPNITPAVGGFFIRGYRIGMEMARPVQVMRTLQNVPREWRGFAAEGVGMAVGIRSRLEPWSRHTFHELLSVSGGRHGYMMYVGLGWALARLPRVAWGRLTDVDPAIAPLILDGFGFHEVFFNTRRTLSERDVPFPADAWPGPHFKHGLMQGVGRGLWFVCGGSPSTLNDVIKDFDSDFAPSLWAGVGLAATYAGGRGPEGLRELIDVADPHAEWVRQGCAFAAEARDRAGTVNDHTGLATKELCGLSVDEAVTLTRTQMPTPHAIDAGDWGVYEIWRHQVAAALAAAQAQAADQA